jgi:uncharacterized protein with FMN-binding domain
MSDASSPRLLLLGTAAVVSIYAAGHARTRAAALRLEAEDAARQRPVLVPRPIADTAATTPVAAPSAAPSAAPVEAPVAAAVPASATRATAKARTDTVATTAPVESVPTAASPVVAAAPPPDAPPASPPPADTVTAPAAPAASKWRDGTYTGWGDSRHGSIEATVVIRAGRIADAYISRCLTRYSCSWIDHLQIQVVDRQGPEVDFVSGATQSVNAFYYAVVEALKVAARP